MNDGQITPRLGDEVLSSLLTAEDFAASAAPSTVEPRSVNASSAMIESLLVPHQRQCRELAQLRLGVLDAAAAVAQGQDASRSHRYPG